MPNLVGTSLNQVPTNSMLGGLAYQDPDHASIKDLDLKNLSQINSEIADTAVDVFVYDTRKDSDGGAWRKRTQNTSWYNETLGTATRGTRKEFPAVAVIVATVDDVIIYDGDDPDLPMWMVFKSGDSGSAWETYYLGRSSVYNGSSGPQIRAIAMLNGRLAVGKNWSGTGNYAEAYTEIGFIGDRALRKDSSSSEKMNNSIVSRNGSAGGYSKTAEGVLKNPDINAIAMTVRSNAPIDGATGLNVPTIAVATVGGICVVQDDRTVIDFSDNLSSTREFRTVAITGTDVVGFNWNNGTVQRFFDAIGATSDNDVELKYNYTASGGGGSTENVSAILRNTTTSSALVEKGKIFKELNVGTADGLTRIIDGVDRTYTPNSSFGVFDSTVAYITSDYNTGYMIGDIKGAFLSNTDATNITGGNLISNGDAWSGASSGATSSTPPTGWTGANGAKFKINSGGDGAYINLVNAGSAQGGPNSYMYQAITTVAGKKYKISVTQIHHATITVFFAAAETSGGSQLLYNSWTSSSGNTPRYEQGTFTATGATTFIRLGIVSGTNDYWVGWDDLVVTEVAEDRSVNAYGLHSFGTITKNPVATGAELVAYSGFNASNYLRHTIATNYGSAATITMGGWCKIAATHVDADYNYLCSVRNTSAAITAGVAIRKDQGDADSGKPYFFENTNNALQSTGPRVDDDQWHHIIGVLDGTSKKIYIDGKLINQSTVTAVNLSAVDVTNVGHYVATSGTASEYYNRGSLALIKFSASAASTEQIKKMYEDEKHLFQENAKATLYGSSDAVTALAYDDTTTTLHVGTSAGRSEFQGLRRINNTTTAVTTAISASNGLVTEQ